MKQLLLLLFFSFSFLNSQTTKHLKIIDAESSTVITDVRIIFEDQVFYTNEDGLAILPAQANRFDVSTAGYEVITGVTYQPVIKLKPLYKDIDEVKMISIDVKKIFQEVLRKYSEKYYANSALYEVTFSQKSFENDQMKLLMVSDGKFWTRDGSYNSKEAFKGKLTNFVQLRIDDLRYLKSEPNDFKVNRKKSQVTHDYVGLIFFDYELYKIVNLIKAKGSTISGFLIYENDFEQEISFRIKTTSNLFHIGKLTLNKADNVITRLEVSFDQKGYKPIVLKAEDGKEFTNQLGNGTILYEFYKNGNRYVPSIFSFKTEGFTYTMDDKKYEYRTAREIIFKKFSPAKERGFTDPIDISSPFWNNMKVSDKKGLVNLSESELNFVNDKNAED